MMITGKRGTYLTRHKVAFDNDGRMLALKMTVYIGAGNSIDVSMAVVKNEKYRFIRIVKQGFG